MEFIPTAAFGESRPRTACYSLKTDYQVNTWHQHSKKQKDQQTRVYPYPLGEGSARPNPKMGATDPENSLFLGFSVFRGGFRR